MEGEKQGRLGNLDKMTVPQLRELLDRQEKLLSKQRFLHTLPDGGQKVKDFAARLQQMISQRQGVLQPQTDSHHSMPGKQTESRQIKSQSTSDGDSDCVLPDRESLGEGETADDTAALSNAIDSIVISELTAPRMTEKCSELPRDGSNLETRFPNSYENVMKKNQTAEKKKVPFRPNRSLKISDIHQLPEDYKYKSRLLADGPSSNESAPCSADSGTEGRKKEAVKVQQESAVTGPDYKFQGAKEISLQESLVLQKQQQENLERIQTLHAAERLAERLNIKTMDYNPPSLDMQYRNIAVDDEGNTYDSDDNADEDDDMPD